MEITYSKNSAKVLIGKVYSFWIIIKVQILLVLPRQFSPVILIS